MTLIETIKNLSSPHLGARAPPSDMNVHAILSNACLRITCATPAALRCVRKRAKTFYPDTQYFPLRASRSKQTVSCYSYFKTEDLIPSRFGAMYKTSVFISVVTFIQKQGLTIIFSNARYLSMDLETEVHSATTR